jgi:transcriptional regulator of acetoin/glycerol metabolism
MLERSMLASAGDPFVLEQRDDIHFIPRANWSEARAGTNGPGTALATRKAYIVGPEHFCGAWHPSRPRPAATLRSFTTTRFVRL